MRNHIPIVLAVLCALSAPAELLVIDHRAVAQFDQLGDDALAQAKALSFTLRHASVGGNISDGLNALASNARYNRSCFHFEYRGNPGARAKVDDFNSHVRAEHSGEGPEVLQFKYCFIDTDAPWAYTRDTMESLEADLPQKTFVWWTTPITTSGSPSLNAFNTSLRNYCQARTNVVVFDLAAIESHEPDGTPHTANGMEAMVPSYSSDGGHLSSVGALRVAKALWVMQSQLAGWAGVTNPPPPPPPDTNNPPPPPPWTNNPPPPPPWTNNPPPPPDTNNPPPPDTNNPPPIAHPDAPKDAPETKAVSGTRTVVVYWSPPEQTNVLGSVVAYWPAAGGEPKLIALPTSLHTRLKLPKGDWNVAVAYYSLGSLRSDWSPAARIKVPTDKVWDINGWGLEQKVGTRWVATNWSLSLTNPSRIGQWRSADKVLIQRRQ